MVSGYEAKGSDAKKVPRRMDGRLMDFSCAIGNICRVRKKWSKFAEVNATNKQNPNNRPSIFTHKIWLLCAYQPGCLPVRHVAWPQHIITFLEPFLMISPKNLDVRQLRTVKYGGHRWETATAEREFSQAQTSIKGTTAIYLTVPILLLFSQRRCLCNAVVIVGNKLLSPAGSVCQFSH